MFNEKNPPRHDLNLSDYLIDNVIGTPKRSKFNNACINTF